VLAQIVELAGESQVDAVIVAGDIYDRSVPPAEAVRLLDEILNRLCGELGIPVILIAGNHDGPERLSFASQQLTKAGLHIAGQLRAEPDPIVLPGPYGDVAFYAVPYADPLRVRETCGVEVASHDEAIAHLTGQIRAHNTPGRPCVLIGHCSVEGGATSESERPLAVGGIEWVSLRHFYGFSYVALGHLHGPQRRGAQHIRYSGSILKYSFSEEKQRKSVTLVALDGAGNCRCQLLPLKPLHDMRTLQGNLSELLERGAKDPASDDYVLCRLTDTQALLEPMNKLRAVYPNILHLERPGLETSAGCRQVDRARLRNGELEMFKDFYRQLCERPLSEAELEVVRGHLTDIHREQEG
jgi:exonuclease SbcD